MSDPELPLDYYDDQELRVLATLRAARGRAQAIGCEALAAATGIPGREIQKVIHRLRVEHGRPIASTAARPAGYYLIETAAELERCYQEHRSKALGTLAAMAALRRVHLRELLGQLQIECPAAALHPEPVEGVPA